jgi:hypothetical protein
LLAESLDSLRKFALEAEYDFGGQKQFGDHGEGYSSRFNVQCSRAKKIRTLNMEL